MTTPRVSVEQVEAVVRQMPGAFTILDFVEAFREQFPDHWQQLVKRYGLYGSGTRYSALTYLSNRLSAYSRQVPGPVGANARGLEARGGALPATHYPRGTAALCRHLSATEEWPEVAAR